MRSLLAACVATACWIPGVAAAQALGHTPPTASRASVVDDDEPRPMYAPTGGHLVHRAVRYEPGMPIPRGARITQRPNVPLVVGGAGAFAVAWSFALVWSVATSFCGYATPCETPPLVTAVPLVGPWLALTDRARGDRFGALLIGTGLVEVVGFAGLLTGLADAHTYVVTEELEYAGRARGLAVAPLVGRDLVGLGVEGAL